MRYVPKTEGVVEAVQLTGWTADKQPIFSEENPGWLADALTGEPGALDALWVTIAGEETNPENFPVLKLGMSVHHSGMILPTSVPLGSWIVRRAWLDGQTANTATLKIVGEADFPYRFTPEM